MFCSWHSMVLLTMWCGVVHSVVVVFGSRVVVLVETQQLSNSGTHCCASERGAGRHGEAPDGVQAVRHVHHGQHSALGLHTGTRAYSDTSQHMWLTSRCNLLR